MDRKRCRHCQSFFLPNPRIKNQQYCSRPECQQARKTHWQREKVRQDPDYQADHQDAQKNWLKHHPDYWKNYRTRHPSYVQTNRQKQKMCIPDQSDHPFRSKLTSDSGAN